MAPDQSLEQTGGRDTYQSANIYLTCGGPAGYSYVRKAVPLYELPPVDYYISLPYAVNDSLRDPLSLGSHFQKLLTHILLHWVRRHYSLFGEQVQKEHYYFYFFLLR